MFGHRHYGMRRVLAMAALVGALLLGATLGVQAKDKKKDAAPAKADNAQPSKKDILENLDISRIVWPNPPAIARIKFVSQFYGEKRETKKEQKKAGWMDRLAGVAAG